LTFTIDVVTFIKGITLKIYSLKLVNIVLKP